jgi:hypothetical protein
MKTYQIIFSTLAGCEVDLGLYKVYNSATYNGVTVLEISKYSQATFITLYFWADRKNWQTNTLLEFRIIELTQKKNKRKNKQS